MDHRRFARTAVVCTAAGMAASFAVLEAAPILCLAFLTVAERRSPRWCAAAGTALLGAWLYFGGPWLLAAMGVVFALSAAALAARGAELTALVALAAGLVALAAPWATTLADSLTAPGAGAAFGLWLALCTFPLHLTRASTTNAALAK